MEPPVPDAAQERVPQEADEDGDHPRVQAQQGEGAQVAGVRARGDRGHLHLVGEGEPGRGDEGDLVRLSVHPRVGELESGAPQARDRPLALEVVAPVGLVHHDLGHRDRLGAAVHDVHAHPPGLGEGHPLDRELLDGRERLPEQGGGVGLHEPGHQAGHQDQRQEPEDPLPGRVAATSGVSHNGAPGCRHPPPASRRPRRSPSSPAPRTRSGGRGTCAAPGARARTRARAARPGTSSPCP